MALGLAFQLAVALAANVPDTTGARAAADSVPRLYSRAAYGSQAVFSPFTVLLNKGFDHFQARGANRDVREFRFDQVRVIGLDALLHPGRAIEHYPGWGEWLRTEILPLGFTTKDARWAVNYSEHLVAGGLTYRQLGQWYAAHGFPVPRVWAGLTTFGASLLNEAAEFQDSDRAASSTVADLLVFDLGGIVMFSWDAPVRFFVNTLQASDWSTQASFMFPNGELQNNGQYYVLKIPVPKTETRLFTRFGMGFQAGLTRVIADHGVSVALGFDTQVRNVDPVTRDETIGTVFSGGLYVDRENSLLTSLTAGPTDNRVVLNVFPGVLPGPLRELGMWSAYTRDRTVLYGLVYRRLYGVGVGYAR
jgi:hypothetical protein